MIKYSLEYINSEYNNQTKTGVELIHQLVRFYSKKGQQQGEKSVYFTFAWIRAILVKNFFITDAKC